MELNLKGKRACVTGGSKGIGLAIKKALEKEGVECISWSRSEGVDLMDFESAKRLIKYPDVDFLVNNVGGMGTCDYSTANLCMKKNYNVMNILIQSAIKNKRTSRVITISSIYGREKGHNPFFTASKAAQIAYMKSLAGTKEGITFNTICPGYINTKKEIKKYAKKVNAPIGQPEDVAELVVFLCSEKAKFINGSCITVDGGASHSF